MIRKKIEITAHAKQRLVERMPELKPNNYNAVVSAARYKGETQNSLRKNNPRLAEYISKRFYNDNSTEIRLYKNCVFVFCGNRGHSRTLKTVVNIF